MILPALPPRIWPWPARRHALIWGLIAICCTVELILTAADLKLIGSVRWRGIWLENGAFWAGLLRDWQPNYPMQPTLMFGSYAFLHTGPIHLLGNMLAIGWIGPYLLQRLGGLEFALLWAMTACGGGLCFALLSSSPAPMVGASGAIFGLLGAWVALDYLDRGRPLAGFNMTLVLIAANLVMLVLERGTLAWETHLGGYLAGLVAIAVLRPARQP